VKGLHPLYQKTLKTLEFNKILKMVAEFASCEEAKSKLMALEPSTQLLEASRRLLETTDARGMLERRGAPSLGGVKNVLGGLHRARIGSVLSPGELLGLAQILKVSRGLLNYREEDDQPNALDSFFFSLEANRYLEDKIFDAILSEEEIADRASPKLADIRRKINMGNHKVRELLNKFIHSSTYQKYLQEPIITMRGGRLCIPVRQECRAEVPGMVHDTSASGATLFVEPMSVVEANNELRMLQNQEKNEIERILAELSALSGEFSEAIERNYRTIVELDVVFAKAKFSREGACWEPKLNDTGCIDLKGARHPLIEKHQVVPIDVRLGRDFDTLVVTGPNTGGKTVTLKTLGLFCIMAASGLHLFAAEGSEVGVFSNIFADIGDEQSIEQSLSTFSSHMKNIVEITKSVAPNTLTLFDELGAGTDPAEGAALAVAILEHVRKSGAKCAATTHYSELKIFALSTHGVENGSCEFDVESLKPTYRLLIGVPGKSNAFAISSRLGLSDAVIEDAKARMSMDNVAFEDILAELEKGRKALEERLEEAEQLRLEAGRLKEETASKKAHYEKTRDQAIEGARAEARRIVSQAKFTYEKVMEELEELRRNQETEGQKQRLNEARSLVKGMLKNAEEAAGTPGALRAGRGNPNQKYAVGDTVQILNLNKPATVLTKPDKDGNLFVQAGIIRMSVNKRDLQKIKEQEKPVQGMVRSEGSKSFKAVKTEVDLRGQDSEEAIFNLEKYLDDAMVAGLNTVTIIHGKGTGALRAAVGTCLKRHPHVKSFRAGRYGEGELGVTVVDLK
jgi:DNA mismatch repair protein MutS2